MPRPQAVSSSLNPWKVAALTLALLFVIILIFRNLGPSVPAPSPSQTETGQTEPVVDTSNDPEIALMVISDKTCQSCDTSQVLGVIKQQLFPSVTVTELDYSSSEAKKMITELDIQALPAYIFDSKITQAANYGDVAPALIKKGERYVVNPAAVGAAKYLNPPSADDDPVEGAKNAPVTIIEFSDFQCPFCERFYTQTLPQIENEYIKTGKAKLVYRDFPLSFHENAQKAAEAGECADEQGKFWVMHDMIFENQASLSVADLKKYAGRVGLDQAKFDSCLDSSKYAAEVQKDQTDGQAAGVTGTPGFVINGRLIVGAQPFSAFKQAIDAALAESE